MVKQKTDRLTKQLKSLKLCQELTEPQLQSMRNIMGDKLIYQMSSARDFWRIHFPKEFTREVVTRLNNWHVLWDYL